MQHISIKELRKTDMDEFKALIRVFEDVFEMKDFELPSVQHLRNVLNTSGFYAFVAIHENRVIGGLTIYTLPQYYSTKPLAYVYDLAIDRAFQRKGIGSMLMNEIRTRFSVLGYEEIFVQADEPDEYALDFYRSTQPTAEEPVRHFYYTL